MASGGAVALWRGAWEPAEESQPEGREGEDGGGQQRSNVQLSNQSWTAKLDREVDILREVGHSSCRWTGAHGRLANSASARSARLAC